MERCEVAIGDAVENGLRFAKLPFPNVVQRLRENIADEPDRTAIGQARQLFLDLGDAFGVPALGFEVDQRPQAGDAHLRIARFFRVRRDLRRVPRRDRDAAGEGMQRGQRAEEAGSLAELATVDGEPRRFAGEVFHLRIVGRVERDGGGAAERARADAVVGELREIDRFGDRRLRIVVAAARCVDQREHPEHARALGRIQVGAVPQLLQHRNRFGAPLLVHQQRVARRDRHAEGDVVRHALEHRRVPAFGLVHAAVCVF